VQLLNAAGDFGPPTDLWDTDWSNGAGYYWTVVAVNAVVPGAVSTSVSSVTAIGATTVPVGNPGAFSVGDAVTIGSGGNQESGTIVAVTSDSISLAAALKLAHGVGEPVVRTGGNIRYVEADLAQEQCAAGRVLRFGKESEPSLASGGEPFSSGLSPDGKLSSGSSTPKFYGSPLVAWTPALGARVYQVQWSKSAQPFVPESDPATGALGILTANTSAVLPLTPGVWYYRVRGYDYSLPTGAQEMSWSDPQQITATQPTFVVVGAKTDSKTKEVRVPTAGFSVRLPAGWSSSTRSETARSAAALAPLGTAGSRLRLAARAGSAAGLFVETAPDRGAYANTAWVAKTIAAVKTARNVTGPVRCKAASIPAGAGVRCTLALRVGSGSETALVYLIQHRNATYTLTFASRAGRSPQAVFAATAGSFRFTA
jgi:hypothetical protein